MPFDSTLKKMLVRIDAACTSGQGLRWYRDRVAKCSQADLVTRMGLHTFRTDYPHRSLSTFATLCDKYGSDKGTRSPGPHPYGHSPHTYADFYSSLFDHCRHSISKIFECGLGTNNPAIPSNMGCSGRPGASLRAWRDYFPNAKVYGADIDRDVLFTEDRIATYYVDQTCHSSIANLWAHPFLDAFDLIVDDGLHTFEAGVTLFEQSHIKVRPGGLYVIEDVTPITVRRFASYFETHPWDVCFVTFPMPTSSFSESNLVVLRAPISGSDA